MPFQVQVIGNTHDLVRLKRAMTQRQAKIVDQIVKLAEADAERAARGKTPGTAYEATVEVVGEGRILGTLEANPRNDHADLIYRIATKGRRSYVITPKRARVLLWPAGKKRDPIEGVAQRVVMPEKAPVLDENFLRTAMRNAIQKVRNRYRD